MPDAGRDGPFWEAFPNMFPGAISEAIGNQIPWHTHAASPKSSQTFCVSAFGPLIDSQSRSQVCRQLADRASEGRSLQDGEWQVLLEFSDRSLLSETMGTPTQVDVLLVGPESIIAVESKLVVDALEGFGCCSKFKDRECLGHYGPDSDATHPATWCLLERWDGKRSPRLYWALGRSYFKPSVFEKQNIGQQCPFQGSGYQLMRTYLSAAAYAQKKKRRLFGTLILCPRATSEKLSSQVKAFQEQILLPEYSHSISFMYYEEYFDLLRTTGNATLCNLADFLQFRLAARAS
jgi:hypothetical protein